MPETVIPSDFTVVPEESPAEGAGSPLVCTGAGEEPPAVAVTNEDDVVALTFEDDNRPLVGVAGLKSSPATLFSESRGSNMSRA